MAGYEAAIADEIDVIVKVDGDGQMDPPDPGGISLPRF